MYSQGVIYHLQSFLKINVKIFNKVKYQSLWCMMEEGEETNTGEPFKKYVYYVTFSYLYIYTHIQVSPHF